MLLMLLMLLEQRPHDRAQAPVCRQSALASVLTELVARLDEHLIGGLMVSGGARPSRWCPSCRRSCNSPG
jgi:hypothetical protein